MKKITILLLFVSIMTKGNVYYVAADGGDTNSGTSLSSPFKTISKAVGIAIAGDIIYLRGGTYAISATIVWKATPKNDRYLIFQEQFLGRAVLT
jgi:hypothetical protein